MLIRAVITWTFKRVVFRFSWFQALLASTSRTPSVFSHSKIFLIAWTAALHPASWPPHSWSEPTVFWMSALVTLRIALLIIRRTVSLMPIGRTPGCLSSGISLQAMKAARPDGSTKVVLIRLAMAAKASHRSLDAPCKAVHMRRHPIASTPEGPAEPLTRRAAERIIPPLIWSKSIGWKSIVRVEIGMRVLGLACWAGGCLSFSISRMVNNYNYCIVLLSVTVLLSVINSLWCNYIKCLICFRNGETSLVRRLTSARYFILGEKWRPEVDLGLRLSGNKTRNQTYLYQLSYMLAIETRQSQERSRMIIERRNN